MIPEFPRELSVAFHRNFIKRNIRKYSEKPRTEPEEPPVQDTEVQIGVSGVSIVLGHRESYQRKTSRKDINDNYQKSVPQPAKSRIAGNIKYQELFSCAANDTKSSHKKISKKISGVRRTSIKSKNEILLNTKIDETNDIILRNLRLCGECQKVTYYTYRKVFAVPVTCIPNDIQHQDEESYQCYQPPHFYSPAKTKKKLKIFLPQKEAVSSVNRFKTVKKPGREELAGLPRERMEGKTGRQEERSHTSHSKSSIHNSKQDDSQLLTVTDKEKDYCEFIDDRKCCSNTECKTFVGEATRNRKLPKEFHIEKPEVPVDDTSDEYLEDSYNYAFQRHVDTLNSVISQHMVKSAPDKTKTHVHIHPTENFGNETIVEPLQIDRKASPKSKKKALTKPEIKSGVDEDRQETKSVSFVDESVIDEKTGKPRAKKNPNEMNIITEKLQEANIFEELNNNESAEPKPMIVFNHVSTEAKSEQISFEVINKTNSRSPSPMLEVPSFKRVDKETERPPL